jgi:hypothetical protein
LIVIQRPSEGRICEDEAVAIGIASVFLR